MLNVFVYSAFTSPLSIRQLTCCMGRCSIIFNKECYFDKAILIKSILTDTISQRSKSSNKCI